MHKTVVYRENDLIAHGDELTYNDVLTQLFEDGHIEDAGYSEATKEIEGVYRIKRWLYGQYLGEIIISDYLNSDNELVFEVDIIEP